MSIRAKDVCAGQKYRVISIPRVQSQSFQPDIGSVGICEWVDAKNDTMCISFSKHNITVLRLEHLEDATLKNIDDTFLITLIQNKPENVLKLIKGIAKVTKHSHFLNFLERGELPSYSSEPIRIELDPKKSRQVKPLDQISTEELLAAMDNIVMAEPPDRNGTIKFIEKDGNIRYIAVES